MSGGVVLLSGGLDSTVLVHHVARELGVAPVHAIAFDYGQRHVQELDCARVQAEAAGAESFRVIDMGFVGELVAAGTSLVEAGAEVPDLASLDESQLSQPPTYVPNRNMLLLSLAAAYAEAQGVRDVFYGAQAHDEYGYWDCTVEFLERINAVLSLNRGDGITVRAPFVELKKSALVTLGTELKVDFSQTWSCYRGGEKPCGTCPTCVERAKAFDEAGLRDPLT
jgi:7-cyano-7-deazaguanine synthase